MLPLGAESNNSRCSAQSETKSSPISDFHQHFCQNTAL